MTPADKKYFENLLAKQTQHFDESTTETKNVFQKETANMKRHFDKSAKEAKKESERHMGVLNEHFKSQVVAVAEQYTSLKDSTNKRFDAVEEAQAMTNEKLDEVIEILHANQEILVEHDRAIKELQQAR